MRGSVSLYLRVACASRQSLDRRERRIFVLKPLGNIVVVEKSWLTCEGRGEEEQK